MLRALGSFLSSLFFFTLAGAMLTVFARLVYGLWQLVAYGVDIGRYGKLQLLFDILELHEYAALGIYVGLTVGLAWKLVVVLTRGAGALIGSGRGRGDAAADYRADEILEQDRQQRLREFEARRRSDG